MSWSCAGAARGSTVRPRSPLKASCSSRPGCRSGVGRVRQVTENLGSVTYLSGRMLSYARGTFLSFDKTGLRAFPLVMPKKVEETMTYQAEISRKNPACFLFFVDQSESMEDPFG